MPHYLRIQISFFVPTMRTYTSYMYVSLSLIARDSNIRPSFYFFSSKYVLTLFRGPEYLKRIITLLKTGYHAETDPSKQYSTDIFSLSDITILNVIFIFLFARWTIFLILHALAANKKKIYIYFKRCFENPAHEKQCNFPHWIRVSLTHQISLACGIVAA